MYLKNKIKKLLWGFGIDIKRATPFSNASYQLLKGLERFEIDLVLDIGANIGQFSYELRSIGFKGRIVSFEPLEKEHEKLAKLASRDFLWEVYPITAIGNIDGSVDINVSANSVSSSILPMLETHLVAEKSSKYIGKIAVPISRLDSIANIYTSSSKSFFIKIDTQGFEWEVLDGANETLRHAKGVLCELSLVELYKGQHLWLDIKERLESMGFTLWAIQTGFIDPKTGKTLQMDAIFFRP
jgi:FkbM family methyltransferase